MLEMIQHVLAFAITLGLIVTIHEWGHFWVARRCGVYVERFSIGFGPVLFSRKDKMGTEYCVAAIPLGGYVKMLDDSDGELDQDLRQQAHTHKTVGQRAAIAAAGPAANFILAAVVFWLLAMMGSTSVKPIVGKVTPQSIAANLGIESGQEIVEIDGKSVVDWSDVSRRLLDRLGDKGVITIVSKYPDSDFTYEADFDLDGSFGAGEITNPLADFGVEPYRPSIEVVFAQPQPGYPAEQAGVREGDRVLLTNGRITTDWNQWAELIRANGGQSIHLVVEREAERVDITLAPKLDEDGVWRIGVAPAYIPSFPEEMLVKRSWGPIEAVGRALSLTWSNTVFVLDSAKKMILGIISTKNLSGPISIAKVASTSVDYGLYSWLSLVALLSISIGVLNLLPIPVLDGGHLLFLAIEAVKGSPVSERIQAFGYQLGFIIIIGVMFLAIYNDIARL